jgi:hypothetical protein
MHNLTTLEAIEFERDIGRPPDPPVDPETMYREPGRCVLSPGELRAILGEYDAGHSTASEPATEPATGDAIDPDHYKVGGIETIDYMRAKSTPEEFEGYLRLSALKYLSRVGHKNGDHDAARAEEYKKARWFIDRLIQEIDP